MTPHSLPFQKLALFHLCFAACLIPSALTATETLGSEFRTNGPLMHRLVAHTTEALQQSSAVIYYGRNEEVSYGTVILADGYILTKASEINGKKNLSVRIDRQQYPLQAIIAEDPIWDIALIKIDATNLTPITFADHSKLEIGTWVIANGVATRFERRPMIGIISATSREIKAEGGPVLGVELDHHKKGLLISKVPDNTSAHRAGLQKGDIITFLNEIAVKKREDVVKFMERRKVGEELEVTFLRDGKQQKRKVILTGRADTFGSPASRNDVMSGNVSRRRTGFPRVLQHDIIGTSQTCGGPLLDLDGKCIGINIARANRCESFAIPVEELREIIENLRAKHAIP